MIWDIAIRKTMGSQRQRFELDIAFRSGARRLALFGPSGAGKSVTLKAIAGLLAPDAGHVRIDAETFFDSAAGVAMPAQRRGLGYVFQEYALFPHLNVRQNVAFGLRGGWRNPPARGDDDRVDRCLASFELAEFDKRYPDQLSGGQRQRTALARALVTEPRALLLDEPFAALDASLRARLRDELASLQARLAIPVLLITHDEADLATFADDVIAIEHGRIAAADLGAGETPRLR